MLYSVMQNRIFLPGGSSINPLAKGADMSELADKMGKKIFLDVCIKIEGLCADLYHFYSKIYEETPEAFRLWKKTALEEECHRKQFELALLFLTETEYEVPNESLKRAFTIKENLQRQIHHIKNNRQDLFTAVSTAVEMEENLADLHVHNSLNFKDVTMQSLFKAMSAYDRGHIADLQTFQSNLNLPLREMEGKITYKGDVHGPTT